MDTDRVLKKLSDDFLEKEQEFKSREGRQRALTTNFLRQNKTIKFHLVTVSVDRQQRQNSLCCEVLLFIGLFKISVNTILR